MGQAIYGINWVCVRDGIDRSHVMATIIATAALARTQAEPVWFWIWTGATVLSGFALLAVLVCESIQEAMEED
jgi:hypothetical protein